jgi:hypothetical protein
MTHATVRDSAIRMMLVILATGLVDIAVTLLVPHPFRWAALVGATVPLSTCAFVIVPMLKRAER